MLQISHLQTHMLRHGNIKPHICTVCNRSFTQASHVKRHMAVHMERRPHVCEQCGRSFAYPSELKAHVERHKVRVQQALIILIDKLCKSKLQPIHPMHKCMCDCNERSACM